MLFYKFYLSIDWNLFLKKKMKNTILLSTLILIFFTSFTHCGSEDGASALAAPTNLKITTKPMVDGSGYVDVFAEAENAQYYKFYFGDVANEDAPKSTFASANHVYKESGTYTIKVQAHTDEAIFISESATVTVKVFIAIPPTGYSTPSSYSGMNLIWSDEFSNTTVDANKWTFETGDGCPNCGWGNNELQYYQQKNAVLVDGHLVIEAKSEIVSGKNYSSARMITKGKFDFKYGRVDVRAALPKGQGLWPAIWMLGSNISTVGWPGCGEIDIMEMVGGTGKDNTVHGTAHWDNAGSHANYGKSYTLSNEIFNGKFHVFTIIWDQDKIQWFVDDVKFNEILITPAGLSEFREKFFLLLNVAVGGNWPGSPNFSTTFPQRMMVDYVRVFQNQ